MIEFKKAEPKAKKPKLIKFRLILLIASIAAIAVLFLYLLASTSAGAFFVLLPLLVFFLFAVLIPTAFTIGIVWASKGYRNFITKLGDTIGKTFDSVAKAQEVLKDSLPYVLPITMCLIAGYLTLTIIAYKKDPATKENKKHLIFGIALMAIGITFLVLNIVLFQKIN